MEFYKLLSIKFIHQTIPRKQLLIFVVQKQSGEQLSHFDRKMVFSQHQNQFAKNKNKKNMLVNCDSRNYRIYSFIFNTGK